MFWIFPVHLRNNTPQDQVNPPFFLALNLWMRREGVLRTTAKGGREVDFPAFLERRRWVCGEPFLGDRPLRTGRQLWRSVTKRQCRAELRKEGNQTVEKATPNQRPCF
jgi:hypothetical protein